MRTNFLWLVVICGLVSTVAWAEKPVENGNIKFTANNEWKPVDISDLRIKCGTALDFSSLVEEGPAGKHGRVIIHADGGFAFEKLPQQRVYFWGCSLTPGAILKDKTKAEIDDLAENIRLQGYNLLRPHFLDAVLTDNSANDLEFKPDFLDRWEYFVSCLKKRGIYLYMDAMSSWKGYSKASNWSKEAISLDFKNRIYVEEAIRNHWEEGVRKLMTRVNPYTQTRLIDDPMVATVLFFNEQNMRTDAKFPQMLEKSWWEYIAGKYKTIEALRKAWVDDKGQSLLDPSVTLTTIPAPTPAMAAEKNQRSLDYYTFVTTIDTGLTRWFIERIRAMGYRGLVTHIDWWPNFRSAVARNEVDVISMHNYHCHPSKHDSPGSVVTQPGSIELEIGWWRAMASARFLDRPYAITEYGHVYWNRYRYEEGMVMGGYSAFQDYDLIMAHASPVRALSTPDIIRPFFLGNDPVSRASQAVAGLLFMRRDVSPATHTVQLEIRPEELFTLQNISGGMSREQNLISLVTKLGITYSGSKPPAGVATPKSDVKLHISGTSKVVSTEWTATVVDGKDGKFSAAAFFAGLKDKGLLPASNRTDVDKGWYETENGQLFIDAKKRILTLKTPRAEGVCDAKFSSPHLLGALTVLSSSKPAQVTTLSLDGKSLADSARILLVYSTDAINSGATFTKKDRFKMVEKGTLPVLMQCGIFSITLKNKNAAAMNIWALNFDGTRREKITPVKIAGDEITLRVDTSKLTNGPTPFFEIAAK